MNRKNKTPKAVKFALWILVGALRKSTQQDELAQQIASETDRKTIEKLSAQFKCAEMYRKTGRVYVSRSFERTRHGKYAAVK